MASLLHFRNTTRNLGLTVPNEDIQIELIEQPKRLEAMRRAWEDLWAAAPAAGTVQHPEMCMSADAVRRNPGRRLALLTAWRGDRLVAALPLVTWSRLGISFFGVASGAASYTAPLFAPGEEVEPLTRKMLGHLKSGALGAVVRLPSLNADGPFGEAVLKRKDALATGSTTTFEIRGVGPGEWDQYLASKTSKERLSGYRRKRRQLVAMGNLQFEEVLETSEKLVTLDWLFQHKRKWLVAKNKKPSGFASDLGYEIRRKQISERTDDRVFCIYRLTLDGRIIAAMLASKYDNVFYFNANAQDSAFDKQSVGRLLMEDAFRAATEDNLTVNLGFGDNEYKRSFANHETRIYSADLLLGGIALAAPVYRAHLNWRGRSAAPPPRAAAGPAVLPEIQANWPLWGRRSPYLVLTYMSAL